MYVDNNGDLCVNERNLLSFLPKNSQTRIRLREVVWGPMPDLLSLFNKAHLLYSTNKKKKKINFD